MAAAVENLAVDAGDHAVHFYADESDLAATVGSFLAAAARDGAVSIVIATEAHRQAFAAQLEAAGVDVVQAARDGGLILLDAAATMASFMPEGEVDRDRFREVIGAVVRQAGESGRPVRAYGEMVALLWEAGDVLDAIELEKLWNELGRELEFSLLCGYHSESVLGDEHAGALQQVCQLHSSVSHAPTRAMQAAREVSADFAADAEAPRLARHFVADALCRWGHSDRLLEDARLLITELATNAVVHAKSPFSVLLRTDDRSVRVSVRDASPVEPVLQDANPMSTSGCGLQLVDALSTRWGFDAAPEGKTVWADLEAGDPSVV